MKAYRPKYIDIALQARKCSFVDQQGQSELQADSVGNPNTNVVPCLNGNDRMYYVDMLKAQIDAGVYHVNSRALAGKLLGIKSVRSMLNLRKM
jgi:anti-sigma28 factor (negative regulator of flagellin synthesis)